MTGEDEPHGASGEHPPRHVTEPASRLGAIRALWIVLCYGVCSIGSAFGFGLMVQLYYFVVAHEVRQVDPATATALGSLATLLATVLVWRMARSSFPPGEETELKQRLGVASSTGRALACAAIAGATLFIAVALPMLHFFVPPAGRAINNLTASASDTGWARLVWMFYTVAVAPASEELVFRGVLFAGLRASTSFAIAAGATTFAFVLMHVWGLTAYPPALIPVTVLGACAQWARARSSSLLPALALHLGYNLASALAASRV